MFKEIDAKALPPEEVKKVAFEIKVLSTMRHDFIVRYHDYCKHNGNIYIIMGYCPGGNATRWDSAEGDMHERIKKQGSTPFPSEQVFKWFLQTALVLHYLHTKKVIHRDIKPQNLFLDDVTFLRRVHRRRETSRWETSASRACSNSPRTWRRPLSVRRSTWLPKW